MQVLEVQAEIIQIENLETLRAWYHVVAVYDSANASAGIE